jgi:hypothetical protein
VWHPQNLRGCALLPKAKHSLERSKLTIDSRILCPFLLSLTNILSSGEVRFVVTAVVPLVGAAIGFIGVWLKDLNKRQRRMQILSEAKDRVEFWSNWGKAISEKRSLTDVESKLIEDELHRSALVVSDAFFNWPVPERWTLAGYEQYLRSVGKLRRLFMIYRMSSMKLRMDRILMYGALVIVIVVSILRVIVPSLSISGGRVSEKFHIAVLIVYAITIVFIRVRIHMKEKRFLSYKMTGTVEEAP